MSSHIHRGDAKFTNTVSRANTAEASFETRTQQLGEEGSTALSGPMLCVATD